MAPFKRVRQPKITTQALLAFDLDESSSDSDFRIEDHDKDKDRDDYSCSGDDGSSDDGDTSDDSDSEGEEEDESGEESEDAKDQLRKLLAGDMEDDAQPGNGGAEDLEAMLKELDSKKDLAPKVPTKPICCVCLGDRSDDTNEIVECDGCGVSVHEGCYGVSDNSSVSSTNSTCSTEPWFCEACRAGVTHPSCELCPNKGGIFKETDVGRWVHLVCALYVPGVAFGEVDQLSSVTLFEMQYNKWGAKVCSLCENSRFARTGVCIGCDAGMCKTYFHVTCAQAAGFLTEAHNEDADAADPFYAHCKVHSEKEFVKKRKRNFHTFHLNMQQKQKEKRDLKLDDPCPAQMRIQRKLHKYQVKYIQHKQMKATPWVPTQKMSRLLTTSASACKRLLAKADIMAVDVELMERQEAQIAALTDIRKKWHIPPAFSVEFIGYYLDRISRNKELKQQLAEMMESNILLSREQNFLRKDYDQQLEENKELKGEQDSLLAAINQLHKQITVLCPNKNLANPSNIGRASAHPETVKIPAAPIVARPFSVPTAAALKMGVGFPLVHLGPPGSKVDSSRLLSTQATSSTVVSDVIPTHTAAAATPALGVQTFECGICKLRTDQHLLAKCDTCQLHYHLGCLHPPLTRHPKKSKLYGWQCSECDRSDESDISTEVPKGPRKARTRFNKDGSIIPVKMFEKSMEDCSTINPQSTKRRLSETSFVAVKIDSPGSPTKPQTDAQAEAAISPVCKKAKLALGDESACSEAMEGLCSPKILTPSRKGKTASESVHRPILANLDSDEPLLLTSTLKRTSTPVTVSSDAGTLKDPLALTPQKGSHVASSDDPNDSGKQARKQKRKDKHKSKHNTSSDTEKSGIKERKHKRKKKLHNHDEEQQSGGVPNVESGPIIPKIKIKFKTLPLPGEEAPEAQFFYVSADMVRSAEDGSRPTSVETVEDIATAPVLDAPAPVPAAEICVSPSVSISGGTVGSTASPRKLSPRKSNQRRSLGRPRSTSLTQQPPDLICCMCSESGSAKTVVTCDVCNKNYHFGCLDPPLKKTPKIRGYSWHCADCVPTDEDKK